MLLGFYLLEIKMGRIPDLKILLHSGDNEACPLLLASPNLSFWSFSVPKLELPVPAGCAHGMRCCSGQHSTPVFALHRFQRPAQFALVIEILAEPT